MAVPLDPGWLRILKASGWQTAAIAVGCGIIYTLVAVGMIQSFGGIVPAIAACAGIICGLLTIMTVASALSRSGADAWKTWRKRRAAKRSVAAYLPHMTAQERAIIGWLLHKNQKMFTAGFDGGKAATLISRGIVARALLPGQGFYDDEVPHAVPDLVWEVLVAHRADFPPPTPRQEGEGVPWGVHWMAR